MISQVPFSYTVVWLCYTTQYATTAAEQPFPEIFKRISLQSLNHLNGQTP